jgi:hypothetical protein
MISLTCFTEARFGKAITKLFQVQGRPINTLYRAREHDMSERGTRRYGFSLNIYADRGDRSARIVACT